MCNKDYLYHVSAKLILLLPIASDIQYCSTNKWRRLCSSRKLIRVGPKFYKGRNKNMNIFFKKKKRKQYILKQFQNWIVQTETILLTLYH